MNYYSVDGPNWSRRCEPLLNDPELQRVLHRDFSLFVIGRFGTLKTRDQLPGDFETWEAGETRPPYWRYVKDLACHYLVNFNLRLAMLASPGRPWRIVTSNLHSTVWDGSRTLFDLNFCAHGKTKADGAFRAAGGVNPKAEWWCSYAEHLPVGQYMPVGIFFPPENDDSLWALWQEGVERTPALRKALIKGFLAGKFVNHRNMRRAEIALNQMTERFHDPARPNLWTSHSISMASSRRNQ